MSTHQSTVVMFGGTRSGKTSLLAETYLSANIALRRGSLEFSPDHASRVRLDNAHKANKAVSEGFGTGPAEFAGVRPTPKPLQYVLDLRSMSGRDVVAEFVFQDTPGAYSTEPDYVGLLAEQLRVARVGILVVDAVELVNDPQQVDIEDRRNNPEEMSHQIADWHATPADRLLLVALVKAETYLRTPEGREQLHAALHTAYAEMFATLREHRENTAVVVCPVQTLGNIDFAGYGPPEIAGGYPTELWTTATDPDGRPLPYQPVDVDQPLRYVASWALRSVLLQRRSSDTGLPAALMRVVARAIAMLEGGSAAEKNQLEADIRDTFHAFQEFTGRNRTLARALVQFNRAASKDAPFTIVQGSELIFRNHAFWNAVEATMEFWESITGARSA